MTTRVSDTPSPYTQPHTDSKQGGGHCYVNVNRPGAVRRTQEYSSKEERMEAGWNEGGALVQSECAAI